MGAVHHYLKQVEYLTESNYIGGIAVPKKFK